MIEDKSLHRNLQFFKRIDGKLVRWRIVLDAQMVLLHEGPADAETPADTILHDDRGISYRLVTTIENGLPVTSKHIVSVPAREKCIINFFVEGAECPFPSCEDLRKKYNADLAALEAGCSDCEKGQIMAKYRKIIEPLIL